MSRFLNRTIPYVAGRKLGLSRPRRFVCDLLHFARQIPSVPMERKMDLTEVVDARASTRKHISWSAIFLKAYAIVAERRPELRRTFLSLPWGHLYEHPLNVASMGIERTYGDEEGVFFIKISRPERLPLATLDELIRTHKTADLNAVDSFQRALWISSLPLMLRRLLWWLGLEVDGSCKAYNFGTYGVSAAASLGAAGLHILSPLATTLNYGLLDANGQIEVRITYDHRVFDGGAIARALIDLEKVLRTEICQELLAIDDAAPRAAGANCSSRQDSVAVTIA
ncbi:hypothetical protein NA78x_002114 [Anatilimnocola sp. NA78]|uniref:hypothetical protein n=1 Tax=Anatilimnocola sp. NA78 TaxID=3415683 RepID=UPI003CE50647